MSNKNLESQFDDALWEEDNWIIWKYFKENWGRWELFDAIKIKKKFAVEKVFEHRFIKSDLQIRSLLCCTRQKVNNFMAGVIYYGQFIKFEVCFQVYVTSCDRFFSIF